MGDKGNEFEENLEDLRQLAADLEGESAHTSGLIAWACFELVQDKRINTLILQALEAAEWVEVPKSQGLTGPRWWLCPVCGRVKYESEEGQHAYNCILSKAIKMARGEG